MKNADIVVLNEHIACSLFTMYMHSPCMYAFTMLHVCFNIECFIFAIPVFIMTIYELPMHYIQLTIVLPVPVRLAVAIKRT